MKKLKKIPKFKSEKKESEFWENNDSTEYIDWNNAKKASFPDLKPSTKTISLRLPEHMLEDIKVIANKNDIPYQSLIKMMLANSLENAN